jgi:thiamine-phosphate pyrophosphorylase
MISKFHYLTQDIDTISHAELAKQACAGGADWVQLRVKNKNFEDWLCIAEETKEICKKYNARLIINDNAEIAKLVGADGVHLGRQDMSPREARKILGDNFIIGGSTNKMEDVKWMIESGVDYLGIGPFRFTGTREKLNPILGAEGIKKIMQQCEKEKINIPFIAIGGIKMEDVETLIDTGVHGIAVSSAINLSAERSGSVRSFLRSLHYRVTNDLMTNHK